MESRNKELLDAAENCSIKVVARLLDNGADVNCTDSNGYTPLHWAVFRGETDTACLLITHGAHIDNQNNSGKTPLHLAAQEGRTDTAGRLITLGARIDLQDKFGKTPLHFAAMEGNTMTAGLLITHGANVNLQDNFGKTALHWASAWSKAATARLLVTHGAKLEIKDNIGKIPSDFANVDAIKQLLEDATLLQSSADMGRTAGLPITHGANIGISDNDSLCKEVVQNLNTGKFKRKDPSLMLDRLLGEGSYESFDMRVMVTGQFGVGKTSLVMILVGDNVSKFRQATDGISLLEGRCGLGIDGKDWILIDKGEYNALDVVYNKVLMSQNESPSNDETTSKTETQRTEPLDTCKPLELDQKPSSTMKNTEARPKVYNSNDVLFKLEEQKNVQHWKHRNMRAQMTKNEIRKKMEAVIKSRKYQMRVERLIFWDFGGQYVYYTTHQTFMTYRALFLVVFDGSKSLHEEVHDVVCFPVQNSTPTAAVFLQHWVNSILTYCKLTEPGIPQILFIATHKDQVPKTAVEERRMTLYMEIEDLFRNYEGRNHLVLEHQLFVNATDRNDPEISTLKQIITDLTFKHPCWGERMPNTWVPLELEIAELAAEGKQILSLKEMEDLNTASQVSVLSKEDLLFFLNFQHSLGKIVYFDTPQLREFVIINPLFMVDVMKSFVTDKQFWPKGFKKQQPFSQMSIDGVIQKDDLFQVWRQRKFSKVYKYKEFIFDMLIHLDILSEQRRYDLKTGSKLNIDKYFVTCMLTTRNTTSYMEKECNSSRAIGLAFVFKGSILPPALPNRLISACLSMWSIKEYGGERLLFSGFVAFSRDKFHDIVVCVESNRILIYIIHERSKGLIVCDIATGVRECIYTTLQRISEFYQSSINPQLPGRELPFHVEFACSDLMCYVPETAALSDKKCACSKGEKNVDFGVWYQNKSVHTCEERCAGLSADALDMTPSDSELLRLSSKLSDVAVKELVIHLGLTYQQWDDVNRNYPRDISMVKFLILVKWRNMINGTYRDLADSLSAVGYTSHELCHVIRMKRKPSDISEEHLYSVPTDEILDALAPEIGLVSFQLGIELGRSVPELEAIEYNYTNDLRAQTRQILYNWRNDRSVKATLGTLQQALVNVERGTQCLKSIVDVLGVKKHHFLD